MLYAENIMKKKTVYLFAFLFTLFSAQQLNAFGVIEFVKELRESADIRADMRTYYESNENIESIIFMDDETKNHVSTTLILKGNIYFDFRAYYKDKELVISEIYYFGNYSPCNIAYNFEKDECCILRGWYLSFIGSNSVDYFINNAEECIKKIEALPEYTSDKLYCSKDENAKEFFDSLPGEAVQIDENNLEKYVKVKRTRVQ